MAAVEIIFQRLLTFLPAFIVLVVLGAGWHFASELLSELRTINKYLEIIASNLDK